MAKNEQLPDDLRFLRLEQVLDLVPVSRATLYRNIKAGQFPKPCRIGASNLWPLTEVRAWVAKTIAKPRAEEEDFI